ncbi:MAG: hypothetical protein WED05_02625 [Candidatus Atabeyarchaeum deiterrae]
MVRKGGGGDNVGFGRLFNSIGRMPSMRAVDEYCQCQKGLDDGHGFLEV